VPLERVLVIDESLSKQLANELRRRGRNSRAIEEMGLKGSLDPDVIQRVFAFFPDPVLVTGDDSMPSEHKASLDAAAATVATVVTYVEETAFEVRWDGIDHRTQDDWEREIVHRWAHAIQEQRGGTVRRYGLNRHNAWRPRKR
jgi:hypothetical protein